MQWNLSKVLSFNAGYVDTASFLALHGLFAAHVTGNFVTLGAALISDNHAGAWTKLAALPMFCVVVVCTRLLHTRLQQVGHASYRVLLWCMLLLFALAAGISWFHTPFAPTDSWISFAVGMLLVAAMAIQNALHRIHWLKESPTTVMTGSTTQLMLDVADWLGSPQSKADEIKARFNRTLPNMLVRSGRLGVSLPAQMDAGHAFFLDGVGVCMERPLRKGMKHDKARTSAKRPVNAYRPLLI